LRRKRISSTSRNVRKGIVPIGSMRQHGEVSQLAHGGVAASAKRSADGRAPLREPGTRIERRSG
jgi:hypothetical protein